MTEYRYEYQEEQHKYYLFALSLLLHGCIILCFIIFEVQREATIEFLDDQSTPQNPPASQPVAPFQQPIPQQAQLTAQSSDFGAPVQFTDDIQTPQQELIKEPDNQQEQEQEEQQPKEKEPAQPAQEPLPVQSTQQMVLPQNVGSASKKKRRKRSALAAHQQQSSPVKKELTFADLAAGFLQTIHRTRTQGNAPISRRGDPNVAPTEQDLKYSSYMAKFQWYLQHSSRIHPFKPNPPISQDAIMKILISIDKEGNVQAVQIVETSGRIDLDAHIEKIIKKAAPYPELPEHFGTSVFTFPMAISIGRTDPRAINAEYTFASQ